MRAAQLYQETIGVTVLSSCRDLLFSTLRIGHTHKFCFCLGEENSKLYETSKRSRNTTNPVDDGAATADIFKLARGSLNSSVWSSHVRAILLADASFAYVLNPCVARKSATIPSRPYMEPCGSIDNGTDSGKTTNKRILRGIIGLSLFGWCISAWSLATISERCFNILDEVSLWKLWACLNSESHRENKISSYVFPGDRISWARHDSTSTSKPWKASKLFISAL